MPRHVRTPAAAADGHEELVAALARELTQSRPFGQPIILEDHTPETKSIRVDVIWDDWDECPRSARATVIEEAYRRSLGAAVAEQIALAVGMTVPEATELGLLPFKIESVRKSDEALSLEDYRQAAIDVGASVLRKPDYPQLRFATLQDAERALERLHELLPESHWAIVEEVYSNLD